jgi:hypothetical protein
MGVQWKKAEEGGTTFKLNSRSWPKGHEFRSLMFRILDRMRRKGFICDVAGTGEC